MYRWTVYGAVGGLPQVSAEGERAPMCPIIASTYPLSTSTLFGGFHTPIAVNQLYQRNALAVANSNESPSRIIWFEGSQMASIIFQGFGNRWRLQQWQSIPKYPKPYPVESLASGLQHVKKNCFLMMIRFHWWIQLMKNKCDSTVTKVSRSRLSPWNMSYRKWCLWGLK